MSRIFCGHENLLIIPSRSLSQAAFHVLITQLGSPPSRPETERAKSPGYRALAWLARRQPITSSFMSPIVRQMPSKS